MISAETARGLSAKAKTDPDFDIEEAIKMIERYAKRGFTRTAISVLSKHVDTVCDMLLVSGYKIVEKRNYVDYTVVSIEW